MDDDFMRRLARIEADVRELREKVKTSKVFFDLEPWVRNVIINALNETKEAITTLIENRPDKHPGLVADTEYLRMVIRAIER